MIKILFILLIAVTASTSFAQTKKSESQTKLVFTKGAVFSVKAEEMLRILMQFSQVDEEIVEPSIRVSKYSFTEVVDTVYADGSADVSATLDSFSTEIFLNKLQPENEFFRFHSTNMFDVENRLRDIRALPRAQFLGHTISYRIGNNGLIQAFHNLSKFHSEAISRSFDYDVTQAMLALSDSMRMAQLLEHGSGAVAAGNGEKSIPYTMTEVHVKRNLDVRKKADTLYFSGKFTDNPSKLNYLEGIAYPMDLIEFSGGNAGWSVLKDGVLQSAYSVDSAKMLVGLDVERIKNDVKRTFTVSRKPIKVTRTGTMRIKEIESHKAEYKEKEFTPDPDATVYDAVTGEIIQRPANTQDSVKVK